MFDVDLVNEIKRIKKDLNVSENGYPKFWLLIHPEFNRKNINWNLKCPMNYMSDLKLTKFRSEEMALPIGYYFIKHKVDKSEKRKCRKVEEFIEQYAIDLYNFAVDEERDWHDTSDMTLMLDGFEEMIESIRKLYISKTYIGLYSWLLDRAFNISPEVKCQENNSNLNKNKSILLKTLYDINKNNLLDCFKKP